MRGRLRERMAAPRRRANAVLLVEGVREVRDAFEPNRVRDLRDRTRAGFQQLGRALEPHSPDQVRRALVDQLAQLAMQIAAALRQLTGESFHAEVVVAE